MARTVFKSSSEHADNILNAVKAAPDRVHTAYTLARELQVPSTAVQCFTKTLKRLVGTARLTKAGTIYSIPYHTPAQPDAAPTPLVSARRDRVDDVTQSATHPSNGQAPVPSGPVVYVVPGTKCFELRRPLYDLGARFSNGFDQDWPKGWRIAEHLTSKVREMGLEVMPVPNHTDGYDSRSSNGTPQPRGWTRPRPQSDVDTVPVYDQKFLPRTVTPPNPEPQPVVTKDPEVDARLKCLEMAFPALGQMVVGQDNGLTALKGEVESLKEELKNAKGPQDVTVRRWDGETLNLGTTALPAEFQRVLDLAAMRRNVLLVGPAGCLHGDSLIHDPTDKSTVTVRERAKTGIPFYVTCLNHSTGKLITSLAMPPVEFPPAPMFEVRTAGGRTFKVTGAHRVWTFQGYREIASIAAEGLRGVFSTRLPSISDTSPPVRDGGVPRSPETTGGFRFGYPISDLVCDAQLPGASETSRGVSPLRAGAPERNPLSRKGDPGNEFVRTRSCLAAARPPKTRSCPPGGAGSYRFPCTRTAEEFDGLSEFPFSSSEPSLSRNTTGGRFSPNAVSRPRPTGGDVGVVEPSGTQKSSPTGQGPVSKSRRHSPHRSEVSPEFSSNQTPGDPTLHDLRAEFCGSPSDSPWWTEEDNIVLVSPIGCEPFFDFHVPVHNNYLYEGVIHHNCGKSHTAKLAAMALGLDFASVSCTSGMSESHLLGRSVPNLTTGESVYQISEFVRLYENGGVFLLDELDAADPNLLLAVNGALANGFLNLPARGDNPVATRHEDFVCVATANTFGRGADRLYAGRNQLDESTLDRFRVGTVEVGYDAGVEASLCPDRELRAAVVRVREAALAAGLKRVVSTRFMQDAYVMFKGCKWTVAQCLEALTAGWTKADMDKLGSQLGARRN